ncbi:sensor histidine kinase [Thermocatellispora tengchongensis]
MSDAPNHATDHAIRPGPALAGGAGPHAWLKLRGWEVLLVVSVLIPVGFIPLSDLDTSAKAGACALMLAILPLYALVGRPAIVNGDSRRGMIYIGLLVVLFAAAHMLAPMVTFALFGLCPQCFMALPNRRTETIAVILLALGPGLRFLIAERTMGGLFNFVTVTTIVVFFSTVFGVWMERIVRQSNERAKLIEELEASRAEVARLSAERGALAERERLAGEIHDTLAQGFTSIIMLLQAAEAQPDPSRHLALAARTAHENLAEARALIAALSPPPLDGSTLEEALRRLTARLGEETGLATSVEVRGRAVPLPPATEVVLVRAAQEGLANVRKHAAARTVGVELDYGRQEVALRVRDDGRGLPPGVDDVTEPGDGPAGLGGPTGPGIGRGRYGLRTMRTRVESAGGVVRVRGLPGEGTTLEVVLPREAGAGGVS